MANQHVLDVTIIWPDDKWEPEAEKDYITNALLGVAEHFEKHPIVDKREAKRTISNKFGRVYAEVHFNPCK